MHLIDCGCNIRKLHLISSFIIQIWSRGMKLQHKRSKKTTRNTLILRGYFGIKYDLDELKIRLLGKWNLDLVFLKVSCLFWLLGQSLFWRRLESHITTSRPLNLVMLNATMRMYVTKYVSGLLWSNRWTIIKTYWIFSIKLS